MVVQLVLGLLIVRDLVADWKYCRTLSDWPRWQGQVVFEWDLSIPGNTLAVVICRSNVTKRQSVTYAIKLAGTPAVWVGCSSPEVFRGQVRHLSRCRERVSNLSERKDLVSVPKPSEAVIFKEG